MRKRADQRGYNLVEVLIAVALLGTVLMTIMTLFYMGRSNVYSGKQMSVAVSIGTHAMEDLSSRSKDDVLEAFKAMSSARGTVDVDSTASLPNDTYSGSILRTSSVAADIDPAQNDVKGLLKKWSDEAKGRLTNGQVAVVMTPMKQWPTSAALTNANATVMRVRVLVRWNEGGRRRQVIMDTVKASRPS